MMDLLREADVQVVAVCDVNQQSSDYSEWGPNELRDKVRDLLALPTWGANFTGCTAGRDPARNIVETYYANQKRSGSYKGCAAYSDFRELLSRERDLDGVTVCTPDHWHAPVAIAAMNAGKHVYCQKPMSHSVAEAREMAEAARRTKVATQVAVANSASEDTRLIAEWIAAGAIGPVRRVENWSTRPFWPQALKRPEAAEPLPAGLDWQMWLGPAPLRPFNHVYLPFNWRGWYDFGNGCLGDMGQYSFDTIFRALKLTVPERVSASSTPRFEETFPAASLVHFDFAARGEMPPVTINWYDGGLQPERPAELEDGREMGEENEGLLFVGDHGTLMCGFEGKNPKLIPESRMVAFQPPPKTLPRSPGHYREWIEAARGGKAGAAEFNFEAPVAEALMLGNIAVRTGKTLRWDSAAMKITNDASLQPFVAPPHRDWAKA
jgi:predicted dehydrogenase